MGCHEYITILNIHDFSRKNATIMPFSSLLKANQKKSLLD